MSAEPSTVTLAKSVCFVVTTPFAVNAFLLGHLKALAQRYRVSLCVNAGDYPLSNAIDPRVRILNIGIRRKFSPLSDLWVLWRLIALFRRERFDSVHSMTPKGGLLGMLAAKAVGIPRRFHTFTGQIWANRSGLTRTLFKWVDCVIAWAATHVLADSASQCKFLEVEGIALKKGVAVLGQGSVCGVDAARFCPDPATRRNTRKELAVSDEACVMLFVGRIARDKGVFDLVRAFVQLSLRHPSAALWVVGPDEEGLSTELRTLAISCADRIRWTGPSFEPEKYMASADFLVLPSYREGFGMVIIEAAACGIPSVAYRIDGVSDAVREGETGVLVTKGDTDELRVAMESLLADSNVRCRLGERAAMRVRSDFSDVAVTTAWMEFYKAELEA